MNPLAIILLAFTAVGPLSARAIFDFTITDAPCIWESCGGIPYLGTVVADTRSCDLNGVEATQYCCSVSTEKAL
ncbi:uncharacterized protein F5147DRAFT_701406 [Suillus discolor]|uniref:Uncharacterized protein n=1 Tax=Suillus discolor TaxID=1912936 RepID=A0A9P7F3Y1_9AGAM|nr:uncharacterized protein F5147DRAFT_701406 [Suillus discolor]KAG2106205.1 hypothetical protein F5147DRAFT_701406 [Suillus discolor]